MSILTEVYPRIGLTSVTKRTGGWGGANTTGGRDPAENISNFWLSHPIFTRESCSNAKRQTRKMGKRSVFEANPKAAHTGHHAKRQRTDGSHERELPEAPAEDVHSAQQLQRALVFDQGDVRSLREGMRLSDTIYTVD